METFMRIKVKKWSNYNSRSDAKTTRWFRFQNDFYHHPKIRCLTNDQVCLLIYLFCKQSTKLGEEFTVSLEQLTYDFDLKVETVEHALAKFAALDLIDLGGITYIEEQDINKYLQMFKNKTPLTNIEVGESNIHIPESNIHTPNVVKSNINATPLHNKHNKHNKQDTMSSKISTPQNATPENATTPPEEENLAVLVQAAKPPKPNRPSPGKLAKIWNEHCGNLGKVQKVAGNRHKHVTARLTETPDLAYWEEAVKRVAKSKFCLGHNTRNWQASFDWFVKPDSHIKVMEGKYDDRSNKQPLNAQVETRDKPSAKSPEFKRMQEQLRAHQAKLKADADSKLDEQVGPNDPAGATGS